MTEQVPTPLLVSVPLALRMLSLGRTRFYELVAQGHIRVLKCGHRTLVPVKSLNDFVASLETADAA